MLLIHLAFFWSYCFFKDPAIILNYEDIILLGCVMKNKCPLIGRTQMSPPSSLR